MTYQAKLPFCPNLPDIEFNGPLDVLLHLVRINKIELRDINLSLITLQYLEWLKVQKFHSLNVAYSYLVMAATLLELKSRSLLPQPTFDQIPLDKLENSEIINQPEDIVKRLAAYASLQEITDTFRTRLAFAQAHHARGGSRPIEKREYLLSEMNVHHLKLAIDRILARKAKQTPITVTKPRHSMPRILKELRNWIKHQKDGAPLQELLFITEDLSTLISYFIGTLELVNRGEWELKFKNTEYWIYRRLISRQISANNLQFNL